MRELNEQELNRVAGGVTHHAKGHVHVSSSAASSINITKGKHHRHVKHCIPTPPIVLPDNKHL